MDYVNKIDEILLNIGTIFLDPDEDGNYDYKDFETIETVELTDETWNSIFVRIIIYPGLAAGILYGPVSGLTLQIYYSFFAEQG